ncbi:DoxX family protein [Allorhizobium taibaishanense]|uniref:Putative membrane protein n=1 Tax=Allorhizobium taibaishanense TaxID=887144 RepID=A0A1Q9A3J7_9HYPH|nr:DoxX family protein [Allorhizobium taibaishanense]MBB4006099.1 putative membrane protein [Allorhizobium taibaishanense]OLP49102.1 hypothetical protein BJF91_18575 [Allorhizobium taibaishanense]
MNQPDPRHRIETWRVRSRVGLSVFYLLAGVLHLAYPAPFLTITPDWVPYAPAVIALTGLCELAGAVGLWIPPLRRLSGIGLALYAVCVFPANIKHAIDSLSAAHPSALLWAYHIIRLPLQPVLVWIALFAGRVVSWP